MSEAVEIQRPRVSLISWLIKGTVALAASAGAFWWAVQGVDLAEVTQQLKGSDLRILILFLLVQLVIHGVRVVRWGLLVRPLGDVSPRAIFAAASVGFPAAFFLPFRLGEFIRPVMLARSGVPFAAAMASVVVERIADGVVNLGLFFIFLTMLPETAPIPDDLRTFSMAALVVFGGGLVCLIMACVAKRPALAITDRLLSPISPTFAAKIMGLMETFIDGVMVLRTPGRIVSFVALSLVFWLSNGAITWVLAQSYVDGLPFLAGPFSISVVVFAVMIPAGPAFAGTLEAGIKFGMAPFGVLANSALVVAVAFHAVQLIQMAIIAGVGFMAAERRQAPWTPPPVEGAAPPPGDD